MTELTIKTDDLITMTEAAKVLGISRPSVYNYRKRHKLATVVIGPNRYLWRAEVVALAKQLIKLRRTVALKEAR